MNEAARTPQGPVRSHRFVSRFAALPPYDRAGAFLEHLGGLDGPLLDAGGASRDADVPAGIAFFGQFIDHEITFDPTSAIDRRNDPQALRNFRTPALDLDSVYGTGPEVTPFLYDERDPDGAKLLTGPADEASPSETTHRVAKYGASDLQRNEQGTALLVDPRNDENVVLSQLALAFCKYHNRVVDYVRSGAGVSLRRDDETVFEAAERLVRWHYQWLVVEEFLPGVCDASVLDEVSYTGRDYFLTGEEVAIPVEFAGAAYRYGHSQIRDAYDVNETAQGVAFFPGPSPQEIAQMVELTDGGELEPPGGTASVAADATDSLMGGRPVPGELLVDWSYFFSTEGAADSPQPGRKIDARLPPALFVLPFISPEEEQSLAARNLLRGKALGLPSGQTLAAAMGIEPLSNEELAVGSESFAHYLTERHRGADDEAPLWLYVLAEADVQANGHRLGEVGSRIVAEVILGMVDADPAAYLNDTPRWTPEMPRPITAPDLSDPAAAEVGYSFGDFLAFATGPTPDGLAVAAVDADGTGGAPTPDITDGATSGEAVVLAHEGAGDLSLAGYRIDFDDGQGHDLPALTVTPGERVVVYTGTDELDSPDYHVVSLGRSSPAINDQGDAVTVRTPTGEVSAHVVFEP